MDVTLHHFCHYITVPSLHNLSALHQWRPSDLQLLPREWKTQTNSNWGEKRKKPFHIFFRGEKHPIMEWTFSLGEKQIWCYSDKTPQQLLIFSISFCRLSQSRRHVLSSPFQFLFRSSHDCGQLPAYDVVLVPPNHLLVPAWVQRHANWSGAGGLCHSVNVSWILPEDPAEKKHFSSSECVSLCVVFQHS